MHRHWVPKTNDPTTIKRLIREVSGVVDTPGFRSWYVLKRSECRSAPGFDEIWRYLKASLHYDVPGPELCEVIWRATCEAFGRFDPNKGDPAKPPHQRFLTHWRSRFHDAVRSTFGVRRDGPRFVSLEQAASRTYSADPFQALLLKNVKALMDQLTGVERTIIELHYIDNKPLSEIALTLGCRNSKVNAKHRQILNKMRKAL